MFVLLSIPREEEAIQLDGLNAAQIKEIREKSEKHVFQAEVNRMMKLIINSLYKNKEVRRNKWHLFIYNLRLGRILSMTCVCICYLLSLLFVNEESQLFEMPQYTWFH